VVRDFETNGIRAIKRLPVPVLWWKIVSLFDGFDFDYPRIERELRNTSGYQEFMLEDVLAFACNGYEYRARLRGLKLAEGRMRCSLHDSLEKLKKKGSGNASMSLAGAYVANLRDSYREAMVVIDDCRRDREAMTCADMNRYMSCIKYAYHMCDRLELNARSFGRRMSVYEKAARVRKRGKPSRPVGTVSMHFRSENWVEPKDVTAYEIVDWASRDAKEGYILLAKNFGPDEIDGPASAQQLKKRSMFASHFSEPVRNGGRAFMQHWIMVVARDAEGRLMAAADGSLIANDHINVFYASHIATKKRFRSYGLGTWLTGVMLQVADDILAREAEKGLPGIMAHENSSGIRLMGEVGEIEFPSPLQSGTVKRLYFHGRIGRNVIWPLRYSQTDTDYVKAEYRGEHWNAVPMFLCFRDFTGNKFDPNIVLDSADLLYDSFQCFSNSKGVQADREYMHHGLESDGPPGLVEFPRDRKELRQFISRTGTLPSLLLSLYPDHKYTCDRMDMLKYMQRLGDDWLDWI